jgi:hypothetical protein
MGAGSASKGTTVAASAWPGARAVPYNTCVWPNYHRAGDSFGLERCTSDLFSGGLGKLTHVHRVLLTARNVSSRNLRVSSKFLTA